MVFSYYPTILPYCIRLTIGLDLKHRRKLESVKDPLLHVEKCTIKDILPSTNL